MVVVIVFEGEHVFEDEEIIVKLAVLEEEREKMRNQARLDQEERCQGTQQGKNWKW